MFPVASMDTALSGASGIGSVLASGSSRLIAFSFAKAKEEDRTSTVSNSNNRGRCRIQVFCLIEGGKCSVASDMIMDQFAGAKCKCLVKKKGRGCGPFLYCCL